LEAQEAILAVTQENELLRVSLKHSEAMVARLKERIEVLQAQLSAAVKAKN
jgi:hypothetical protein